MPDSNRSTTDGRKSAAPAPSTAASKESQRKADAAEHRLRGTELESDFVDAEGDSCVVHRHRTDAESDS